MEINELNEEEKLIMELLEGDLDEESRQLAFQKLAYNPALQEDFLDYISINKIIDEDANNIAVPLDYTNELLAKIESMQPIPTRFSESIKRGIITGIFALLMLLPLFFGVNNSSHNSKSTEKLSQSVEQRNLKSNFEANQIANNNKISTEQNTTHQNVVVNNDLKTNINKSNKINLNKAGKIDIQTANFNSKFNTANVIENRVFEQNIDSKNNSSDIYFANLDNSQNNKPKIRRDKDIGNVQTAEYTLFNFTIEKSKRPPILIQYHLNSAITNPVRNMQKNTSVFSNYGVSVFLGTFPNISFGAEFGNEAFSQIYINSANSTEYVQAPGVFYFGVAGRYDANQWNVLNIHPVSQLFIGGSSLGPLSRLSVQLEYAGLKYFGIYSGIEGGFLLYSSQGKWLSSKKVSAVAGVNIKF